MRSSPDCYRGLAPADSVEARRAIKRAGSSWAQVEAVLARKAHRIAFDEALAR